jgi:hypothetical protein
MQLIPRGEARHGICFVFVNAPNQIIGNADVQGTIPSLAIMYTNGIGKFQRHWTPAFAGVTLFKVIAFKNLDLIIFELFGLLTLLVYLKTTFTLDLMTYLFDTMAYKVSSRRKPGSSVFRISPVNA